LLFDELFLSPFLIAHSFEVDNDLDETEDSKDAHYFNFEIKNEHHVADYDNARIEDVYEFHQEKVTISK
jgi:hypothetical protein